MSAVCDGLPSEHISECYAIGANAFLEEDQSLIPKAVAFCERPEDTEISDYCYGFLTNLASFNFHHGSPAHTNLCNALPEKWQSRCRGI